METLTALVISTIVWQLSLLLMMAAFWGVVKIASILKLLTFVLDHIYLNYDLLPFDDWQKEEIVDSSIEMTTWWTHHHLTGWTRLLPENPNRRGR